MKLIAVLFSIAVCLQIRSVSSQCLPDYTVMLLNNGIISCNHSNTINSTCSFQCNDGYYISGYSNLTCGADSQWDYDAPTCIEGTCDPNSSHIITSSVTGPGSVTCDDVIKVCDVECLNKTVVRHLQNNITFTCNGTIRHVSVRCEKQECLSLGCNTKATCNLDGGSTTCNLINSYPVCDDPDFSSFVLENGVVECLDSNKYRSQCRFTCNDGFTIGGVDVTSSNMTSSDTVSFKRCVDDGSGAGVVWDDSSVPVCQGANAILPSLSLVLFLFFCRNLFE